MSNSEIFIMNSKKMAVFAGILKLKRASSWINYRVLTIAKSYWREAANRTFITKLHVTSIFVVYATVLAVSLTYSASTESGSYVGICFVILN
jgi:hypothetical protein